MSRILKDEISLISLLRLRAHSYANKYGMQTIHWYKFVEDGGHIWMLNCDNMGLSRKYKGVKNWHLRLKRI